MATIQVRHVSPGTGRAELHAPDLVDLEVLSVLRRRLRSGALDERRTEFALTDLSELAMHRYRHLPLVCPSCSPSRPAHQTKLIRAEKYTFLS
ncbi:MAG: hypothetical protein ACR2GH_23085 [Pseudonocardia sp.]